MEQKKSKLSKGIALISLLTLLVFAAGCSTSEPNNYDQEYSSMFDSAYDACNDYGQTYVVHYKTPKGWEVTCYSENPLLFHEKLV